MQTVKQALIETVPHLSGSDTPNLDAQVLLAHVLNKPRPWLLAHPEATLVPEQESQLEACRARLADGEPLPYVLGHWEFFGLDFIVTPDVLIPRPETELLVEHALAWLAQNPQASRAADVGTGSGCIAIALAARQPGLQVSATDISPAALEVARANARKHNLASRVDFIQADLFPEVSSPFDLIAANLPYIPTTALHSLQVFGKEPTLALDGGATGGTTGGATGGTTGGTDGLSLIRRLFTQAGQHLAPKSVLLVEIEASQGQAAVTLASAAFPGAAVQLYPDLAGKDRLVEINF